MLGHRGVRLAITYPEIYEVQTRAILEAACAVARDGVVVIPEIMVPLVATAEELAATRERLVRVAEQVFDEQDLRAGLHDRHDDRVAARPASPRTRSPRTPTSSRSAPTT